MPDHLCDQHCDPECEAAVEGWFDADPDGDTADGFPWRGDDDA